MKGLTLPRDFRIKLSDESLEQLEMLFPETGSDFKLPKRLCLRDSKSPTMISLPPNVEVKLWDRLIGGYKRTSSKSERKRLTIFTEPFQVTIDRDGIADVRYFQNIQGRINVNYQLIKT